MLASGLEMQINLTEKGFEHQSKSKKKVTLDFDVISTTLNQLTYGTIVERLVNFSTKYHVSAN
jgi:hypothetical protein